MKKNNPVLLSLLFMLIASAFFSGPVHATVTEDVGITPAELFQAARNVADRTGVAKEDFKNGLLETSWIESRVRRKNSLIDSIQSTFIRRTKLKIQVFGEAKLSKIVIQGKHQFKDSGSRKTAPWRNLKPGRDEYIMEYEYFQSILREAERLHLGQSAA